MINKVLSPLIKGDHPELDISIFLTEKDIKIYQSMIGSMQCMDCFHRMLWYIWTAITMLSSFRAQLRQGHLNQTKRVYCYLNMKHFKVRFRTDEPDYGNILDIPDYHTWLIGETPYTCMQWRVSNKSYSSSTRRERESHTTCTHSLLWSGEAVTGILHFYNKTPVDSYSKKQAKTEIAARLHIDLSLYPIGHVSTHHQSSELLLILRDPCFIAEKG